MKTLTKLLASAAVALSMSAASAQAAVFIGISTDGGTTISQVFTQADGTFEWLGSGIGGYDTISVEGDTGIGAGLLHSDVVNVNAAGVANVTIFVTHTDIAGPMPNGYFSGLSSNNINNRFTVRERTYADAGNNLWGGTLLADATFTGQGSAAQNVFFNAPAGSSSLFSVTHRFDVATTGGGSTSPTIVLAGIPEPTTWALMIMGFGGAGALLRNQRRKLATA
jgi:hypothetical protein